MKKQNVEDDLEIVAIGSLYKGPWDKKYWSSSRGKDRYPYPVGYQAVRTCDGEAYRMEIQEGTNGPIFLVNTNGGKSAIGQTPDIAWAKFRKKSNSRINISHGKRFSCRSGVEFFGFRNSLVQRLLRELLANQDGLLENGLVDKIFSKDLSAVQIENKISWLSSCPDLLLDLEKQQISSKKSRKRRTKRVLSGLKRTKTQYPSKEMHQGSQCEGQTSNNEHGTAILHEGNDFSPHQILKKDDISRDDCVHHLKDYVQRNANSSTASIFEKETDEVFSSEKSKENCLEFVDLVTRSPQTSVGNARLANIDPTMVNDSLQEDSHNHAHDRSSNYNCAETNDEVFGSKALDDCLSGAKQSRTETGLREFKLFHVSDSLVPDSFEALEDNASGTTLEDTKSNPDFLSSVDGQPLGLSDDVVNNMQNGARNVNLKLKLERSDLPAVSEDIPYAALPPSSAPPPVEQTLIQSDEENHAVVGSQYYNSESSDSVPVDKEIAKSLIAILLPEVFPLLEKSMHNKVKQKKTTSSITAGTCNEDSGKINVLVKGHTISENDGLAYNDALDLVGSSLRPSKTTQEDQLQVSDPLIVLDVKHITADGIKDDSCDNSVTGHAGHAFQSGCLDEAGPYHTESSKGNQENALHVDKPGSVDPKASVQMSKPSYGALASEASNTSFQHHEVVSSVELYADDSRYVRELAYVLDAHDTSKSPQPNLTIGGGRTESSVEVLTSKLETSGLSCAKVNNNNDVGCYAPKDNIPESSTTIHGTPSHDEGYIYDTKNRTVLEKSSVLIPQNKTEVQTSAVGEQDALNGSKEHNSLSLLDDSFPEFLIEDLLKTIPGENQTKSFEVLAHELVHDEIESDSLSQKQRRFEVLAHDDIDSALNKSTNSLTSCIELIGCCMNSIPVSSVLLRRGECCIFLCIICGLPDQTRRTIFIYEFPDKELIGKRPSLHGHATVVLPQCSYDSVLNIYDEKSKVQFTPDGKCLILHDSVRTSWCRRQDIECLCDMCKSAFDGTLLKVVSVKAGYVSVVIKLKMSETASCILVCEPYYIVAAEKGVNIRVWCMNSTWSMDMEEFTLPGISDGSFFVEDMQKIPQCQLIVGHDGVGRFGLWDISMRVLVAKFSYSDCSVHQFLPFAFFCCPKNESAAFTDEDRCRADILRASELSFSCAVEKPPYFQVDGEIIGVWLLVLAVSYDASRSRISTEDAYKVSNDYWRLALLVKNALVLGSILDVRASAANVLFGHGIMGTIDGLVYTWELPTGCRVAPLNDLKGGRVSCVASDESSSAFAVASDNFGVLLYAFSSRSSGS